MVVGTTLLTEKHDKLLSHAQFVLHNTKRGITVAACHEYSILSD